MCRQSHTGKRCSNNWTAEQKQADLARRRERYQSKKNSGGSASSVDNESTGSKLASMTKLSPLQKAYFKGSKAVDAHGDPIVLYHGSDNEFDSFNPATLGRGNDTWGNGFYFTDQKGIATGYAKDSQNPDANVKEFHLNLANPIMIDGREEMSLSNVPIDAKTAKALLRAHPNAYFEADDDDDDAELSYLSDYQPDEYWSKKKHTKAEFDRMIDNTAKEYFQDATWGEMENLYGKDHGAAFLDIMHKETGNDGVIVDFGDIGKHYIAWFPNQMKLTTNESPDAGSKF